MIDAARAQRWRVRADEVRQASAIMDDPKTRQTLERLARTYDALALQSARAEASRAPSGADRDGTAAVRPALPGHALTV